MAKLPPIEPHTVAKHRILKRYLDAWFPILGSGHSRINYVDGFAGPGEYEGGDKGSPIIAIESALNHLERGTLSSSVEVNFCFIDNNKDSHAHLQTLLSSQKLPSTVRVQAICGEFKEVVGQVLDGIEKSGKSLAPSLFFVDPFGFTGIPFASMARILAYPQCEVFINIMVEHINRFLDHPSESVVAHFPSTFGTEAILEIPQQAGNRTEAILSLYRDQLSGRAKYVEKFDMHTGLEKKLYSLFFASNSSKGFLKMKEAMWSVDRWRGSGFSDGDPHGYYKADLFAFDPLWELLISKFKGQNVMTKEVESFVIEKTRYLPTHLRKILTEKEGKIGGIRVEPIDGYKRKKGTFPADKTRIIFDEG